MNAIVDPQKSTTKAVTRVQNLKKAVQAEEYAVCIERAMLWTQFSKNKNNKAKSRPISSRWGLWSGYIVTNCNAVSKARQSPSKGLVPMDTWQDV